MSYFYSLRTSCRSPGTVAKERRDMGIRWWPHQSINEKSSSDEKQIIAKHGNRMRFKGSFFATKYTVNVLNFIAGDVFLCRVFFHRT